MLALLGILPQVFGLGKNIVDLLSQRQKAKSDKELKEIDQQIEAVRDKRAVLVAEASQHISSTLNASARFALAIPAGFLVWKLWAWDKVAGSFAGCSGKYGNLPGCEYFLTDSLSPWEIGALTAIICFYFVSEKFGNK